MKRLASGPLWFLGTWCIYELIVYVTGGPRILGPVLGLTAAAFVVLDPLAAIWQDRPVEVTRVSNGSLSELRES